MKNNRKEKEKKTEFQQCGIHQFLRRFCWFFSSSGVISLSLEHFLAMIPATILVPVLVNNAFNMVVIDISLVLLTSGIGTILFTIISGGKIPAYIGSSFAYIGLTIYLIQERVVGEVSHAMAYTYVCWAYIFSGIILILLSFLYLIPNIEVKLRKVLPATVVGPAISLIGLELADTAVVDSGFDLTDGLVDQKAALVAMITLVVIVVFSLLRHKIFKNAAIIVGMAVGTIVSFALNGNQTMDFSNVTWIDWPNIQFPWLTFPPNWIGLFVSVIPATFILFTENMGRVTIINRMVNETDTCIEANSKKRNRSTSEKNLLCEFVDEDTGEDDLFSRSTIRKMRVSTLSHGVATLSAGLLGSVPNTIYAENIAVMSIHNREPRREEPDPFIKALIKPCSWIPYIGAALFAMLFSCVGVLQTVLLGIPKPVIGGMELFLFGIISAPGIQLLVEQRVNYKKISNQLLTAAVLISGVSGLSVNIGIVELKGMTLGFLVGLVLNLVVLIFQWVGNLSDVVSFDEIVEDSLAFVTEDTPFRVRGYRKIGEEQIDIRKGCCLYGVVYALQGKDCRIMTTDGQWLSDDTVRDDILHSDLIEIGRNNDEQQETLIRFRKTANGLFVDLSSKYLDENIKKTYLNDYEAIDEDDDWLQINASEHIPMRHIRWLLRCFESQFR